MIKNKRPDYSFKKICDEVDVNDIQGLVKSITGYLLTDNFDIRFVGPENFSKKEPLVRLDKSDRLILINKTYAKDTRHTYLLYDVARCIRLFFLQSGEKLPDCLWFSQYLSYLKEQHLEAQYYDERYDPDAFAMAWMDVFFDHWDDGNTIIKRVIHNLPCYEKLHELYREWHKTLLMDTDKILFKYFDSKNVKSLFEIDKMEE